MDFIKNQLTRIGQHLSGLSASQRMLTGCLVAIMVMTVVWWSRYAAEPEMEPVLNQSLSADDIAQITANLDAKQIPHSVVGDKVMVPADRKIEVLAELGYSHSLPHDTKTGFDNMIKQIGLFDSPDKQAAMFLEAKQQTLQMIIGRFPGVAGAVVVVDPTSERSLSGTTIQPTATVYITTRGDSKSANKRLAEAAADVVCGAEAGLERSHVTVVMDGVNFPMTDRNDDSMIGGDTVVELRGQHERYYRDKILEQFRYITGLMVSVTVKTETSKVVKVIHTVNPKEVVSTPIHTDERSEESNSPGAGGEPGAAPNTGISLTPSAGGGGGANTTLTDSKTDFSTDNSHTDETMNQGPGDATVLAASVRVPRSYFIAALRNQNSGKDPDDTTVKAFIEVELPQIRQAVKACTGLTTDDAVAVGTYSDPIPTLSATMPQVSSGNVGSTLAAHTKEIGVGFLAAISLFMVSMMVRKGAPMPVVATFTAPSEPTRLTPDDDLAGEAGDGSAVLDGVELDDDTIKTQQMLQQVQQMVTENPDSAANLVKRWLNRT